MGSISTLIVLLAFSVLIVGGLSVHQMSRANKLQDALSQEYQKVLVRQKNHEELIQGGYEKQLNEVNAMAAKAFESKIKELQLEVDKIINQVRNEQ